MREKAMKNFRLVVSIITIFLIISSNSIFILFPTKVEILAEESDPLFECSDDSNDDTRTDENFLSSFVDVIVNPSHLVITSAGNYCLNFTFDEYNGKNATIQAAELEFTNILGEQIYTSYQKSLGDLVVEGASNATWMCQLQIGSDLIQTAKQPGFYKLILNATFSGKNEKDEELSINIRVPVELKFKIVLIVDNTIYSDIKNKLQTYCNDVNNRVKVDFIESTGTWTTPEALRDHIKNLWQMHDISGAILFGYFPVAQWEFTRNASDTETCPIPIFYEDLDGSFADLDSDGYYDRHYWGANDGPEIWVSFIMPPISGQTIPSAYLDPNGLFTGGGLLGNYYSDNHFTNLNGTRTDPTIDFDWEEDPLLNNIFPDNFSVRWTGYIKIDHNETYNFYTEAKGGVRLWVGGNQLISQTNDKPNRFFRYSNSKYLTKGWHSIKLEYQENGKGANVYGMVKLSISSPKLKIVNFEEFLDKTHLYYSGKLGQPENALLFMDWEYGLKCNMLPKMKRNHIEPLYGSNIIVGGGQVTTNATEYVDLLRNGSELTSVWAHAGPGYHHIKPKDNSNGAPTTAPYWSIRRKPSGLVTLIWGCHAGDFTAGGLEFGVSKNLVTNYAFNTKYGLAATGCTRSYGTTFKHIYHAWQNLSYLGQGYFAFLDYGYDKAVRIQKNPVSGTEKWVEDEVMMGDPFITINHRPNDLKIEIEAGKKFTNSLDVILNLNCTNTGEMSLRNEVEAWGAWEPFIPKKSWRLTDGPGHKIVEFRMRNSYGPGFYEVNDVIGIDNTPPKVVSVVINDGEEVTSNRTVRLAIEVIYAFSGPDVMSLSNDGFSWCHWYPYAPSTKWNLTAADGQKNVFVKVQDTSGNIGSIASDSIILDTTPPLTGAKVYGPVGENGWYTGEVEIELSTLAEIMDLNCINYRLNSNDWSNYSKPIKLNADGYHTVKYFGVDYYGNQENIHDLSLKVDTSPPENLSLVIDDGRNLTNSSEVTLVISSYDALSGCQMMRFCEVLDKNSWGPWVEFSSFVNYSLSNDIYDGIRTVYLQVKDEAGNIALEPAYDSITLDTISPEIVSVTPVDGALDVEIDGNISITFTEDLLESSVNMMNLYVKNEDGVFVQGNIEYQQDYNSVIFDPASELQFYKQYTVTVTPGFTDLAGNHMSNEYNFNFKTRGKVPSEVIALKVELEDTKVKLTWEPPEDLGTGLLLGYNIYRCMNSGALEKILVLSPETTSYFDSTVKSNQTYHYTVSAFNVIGEGSLCDFVQIHIPPAKEEPINEEEVEETVEDNSEEKVPNDSPVKENNNVLPFRAVVSIFIVIIIIFLILLIVFRKRFNQKSIKFLKPNDKLSQSQQAPLASPVQPATQSLPQQKHKSQSPP